MRKVLSLILAIAMIFAMSTLVSATPYSGGTANNNGGWGVCTKSNVDFCVVISGSGNNARISVWVDGGKVYQGAKAPVNKAVYSTGEIIIDRAIYTVSVLVQGNKLVDGSKIVSLVYACNLADCGIDCDYACDGGCVNEDCRFGDFYAQDCVCVCEDDEVVPGAICNPCSNGKGNNCSNCEVIISSGPKEGRGVACTCSCRNVGDLD